MQCKQIDDGRYFYIEEQKICPGACDDRTKDDNHQICKKPGDLANEHSSYKFCNEGDLVFKDRIALSYNYYIRRQKCPKDQICIREEGSAAFCRPKCTQGDVNKDVCDAFENLLRYDLECMEFDEGYYYGEGNTHFASMPGGSICVDDEFISDNNFETCQPDNTPTQCVGNSVSYCSNGSDRSFIYTVSCYNNKCATFNNLGFCLSSCTLEGERITVTSHVYALDGGDTRIVDFICKKFEDGSMYYYPEKVRDYNECESWDTSDELHVKCE